MLEIYNEEEEDSYVYDGGIIYYWMEPEEMDRLTEDIRDELIHNMEDQLVFDDINFTGKLRKSIIASHDTIMKTIEATAPYAYFVEFGLPSGVKVPFKALFKWVQGKLLIDNEKEATAVTYRIRSKILAKGIRPKHFMKKAILRMGRRNRLVTQRLPKLAKLPSAIQQWKNFIS